MEVVPAVRRNVRWVAPALYAAALSVYMWREGVPVGRDRLLLWIVLGLLALSLTNVSGWLRSVVLEWVPLALVLAAYDLLRGQADTLFFSAHFRPQIEVDRFLFAGTVPTVWLQDRLWDGASRVHWYDYASWAVYVSYFLATYVLAGVLWFFARHPLPPLRRDGRAPRGDGLRDLRPLPGCASLAREPRG